MHELLVVGGDLGRGTGSYNDGTFYLPDQTWRSMLGVSHVRTNATLLQRDWSAALSKGAVAGVPLALLGMMAAPAVAIALPFGLTIAAIGAGLAAWHSGTSEACLLEITFDDGRSMVAICDADLLEKLDSDLALTKKVGFKPAPRPAPPVISAARTEAPALTSDGESAGLLTKLGDAATSSAGAITEAASTVSSAVSSAASNLADTGAATVSRLKGWLTGS